jgi:hypothetical protein
MVDEDIRRSVVGSDESVTLVRVKPLHCSLSHCALLPERPSGPTGVHPGLHGRLLLSEERPGKQGRPLSESAGAVTQARTSTTTALI